MLRTSLPSRNFSSPGSPSCHCWVWFGFLLSFPAMNHIYSIKLPDTGQLLCPYREGVGHTERIESSDWPSWYAGQETRKFILPTLQSTHEVCMNSCFLWKAFTCQWTHPAHWPSCIVPHCSSSELSSSPCLWTLKFPRARVVSSLVPTMGLACNKVLKGNTPEIWFYQSTLCFLLKNAPTPQRFYFFSWWSLYLQLCLYSCSWFMNLWWYLLTYSHVRWSLKSFIYPASLQPLLDASSQCSVFPLPAS